MNNDTIPLVIHSPFLFLYSLNSSFPPVEHLKEHPCKFIGIAEKQVCRDTAHFESYFQDVIDKGGEGIILRDPQSLLQSGRSAGYLKHKVLIYFLSLSFPLPPSPPATRFYSLIHNFRNIEMQRQK